jgi:nucleotide-binding universal stress UspA family protein
MVEQQQVAPVLAPVDFSSHSEIALINAVRLTVCLARPLIILHVVHDQGDMPGYYGRAMKKKHLRRIEDEAEEMMTAFLADFSAKHPEIRKLKQVESMLVRGLPANRILEVAEQESACMIVMGSRGLTGFKHLMLGSVAERIVRLSPIPVAVIKDTNFPSPL